MKEKQPLNLMFSGKKTDKKQTSFAMIMDKSTFSKKDRTFQLTAIK